MTFERKENLNGNVAVVTGANGGIGRAICKRLALMGATVYGIVRSKDTELQEFLNQFGSSHRAFVADVTDSRQLSSIVKEIPKCDILINTAGKSRIIPHAKLNDLSDEEFDNLLTSNLRSVFSTIRSFLPSLQASEESLVINISSASSLRTGGSNIAYAAAKAGVDSMTRNLAIAFAPNIRFISINPSAVDTGFLPIPQERYAQNAAATPMKRIATVEDIANAVEAFTTIIRFSTGNCVVVDGGRII